MIWPLLKYDLRKVLPLYLTTLGVMVGFLLITRDVLDSTNVTAAVIALAQGWLVAWRIFRDEPGCESFIFSRAWTRPRVFWQRWTFAMVLLGLNVLVVYILLAAGTRTVLYRNELPYFPMVQRFELSVLRPIAMAQFLTFHIIMLLMVRSYVTGSASPSKWKYALTKLIFVILFMILMSITSMVTLRLGDRPTGGVNPVHVLMGYAAIVIVLSIPASLNCYRNMEIQS